MRLAKLLPRSRSSLKICADGSGTATTCDFVDALGYLDVNSSFLGGHSKHKKITSVNGLKLGDMKMDVFDKIKDGLMNGTISRRHAMQMMAATGAVAVTGAMPASRAKAAAEDHPMFFTWPGYDDLNFYQDYIKKHGGEPRFSLWGDEEEGVAKLVSGFSPDLIFPCAYKIKKWYETGRLGAIDTSKLSEWNNVFPALREMDGVVQGGDVVWVPIDWGQTSVLYRTDLAPEYVDNETWGILWDEKYQGRVATFDSLVDAVVVGGLMAGIDNIFDYTSDADLEATRDWTRRLVNQVRFFSNDPTTLEQALASGEIVAATTWNESLVRLKNQGLPVAYMNPKEGAMTWVCGMSIIKDSPLADKAHDMIDAMMQPAAREYEMTEFGYGSAVSTPYGTMDPAVLAELGHSDNPTEALNAGIFQLELQGEERLQEMFDEAKAGL